MRPVKIAFFALMAALTIQFFTCIPASSAELGVGFRVVPTGGKVGGNNQLWFALDRGESGVRQFEVISSSDIKQQIQLTFVVAQTVDGQPVAGSEPSEISSWIAPSDNNFILNPGASKVVEIKTKVPLTAKDGTYRAYLKVGASAAKLSNVKNNETQAIVKNAISFNKELYVLVGDAKSLTLDFEILSLTDFTDNDGAKHITVEFENSGQLPLGLKSNLTLVSTEFSNLSYGPFIAGSAPILENGDKGTADFTIPAEVEPGNYRILVQASQDSVIKNKVFEQEITFPRLGGFRAGVALIGLILLILAVTLLRFGIKKLGRVDNPVPTILKRKLEPEVKNDQYDVNAILEEIFIKAERKSARANSRKSTVKSSSVRRKTSEKSVKRTSKNMKSKKLNSR